MSSDRDTLLKAWLEALRERHLADLGFSELRRGVQALSQRYVHRRETIATREIFGGAGKRAAFAIYYTPLHFLAVAELLERDRALPRIDRVLDLGCGSGAAGAAVALAAGRGVTLAGVDRSRWATGEADWNWKHLGLHGRARPGDLVRERLPGRRSAIVLGYAVNELAPAARDGLLPRLVEAGRRGATVLVVEPIARRPVPWWDDWNREFEKAGGHAELWRFKADLPEFLLDLDRAAGLDHRELKARTLRLG